MSLSLADIKRADVQSFRDVASALDGMATANSDMKSGVGRLPIAGDAWKGVSGDAAHHELDGFGRLLEGSADAKKGAAAKIRRAADEFEGVKQLLTKIEQDASKGKFTIDMSTGKVTPPSGDYDKSELDYLTNTLKQIQAAGDAANADLAAAVKAAKELPDPSSPAGAALPTTPTSTVKPGGAFGGVDNLVAPKPDSDPGATKAAAAGTDTQANYKEWYPKSTAPAGDKLTMDPTKAGTLTGSMGAMEKNRPPDAPYKPAFGEGVARQFGKGVNERVDQMIEGAKDHSGIGGWEKFKESWTGTAEGLQHETMRQLFPGVAMAEDAKSMIDQAATSYQHPETIPENLGKTTADVAAIGATAPLGGEGALSRLGMEDAAVASRGGLHDLPGGHLFDAPSHPHADVPSGGHGDAPGPPGGDHSGSSFGGDHTPPSHTPYAPVPHDAPPPPPLPPDHSLFEGYHPTDPGPKYTNVDGSLRYPDASDPSKPYAVTGTVVDSAQLPKGTVLGRFGFPGGEWLAPEGTPFAKLALPPESALKPYFEYVVSDPTKLPPGWRIEESQVAPWFNQPGMGPQYRIIGPPGVRPNVEFLEDSGFLSRISGQHG
ncbi:TNT domain-containing protein [Mycobacteroides salmoniphilum]|uniref:TNT domain-containing protein n=1 Tax=Mycobacteroides salmoniphilum TaxID=404941 RepID=UPI001064EC64|nr:TNT domain-containing protein [Mycobacteroides salmoniphilum]TDZ94472.1 hypothetical protein CCUG62472_02667 [Mycobacteroides salmoniphilum]